MSAEVMPVRWDGVPHGLSVSLSPTDEFDFPLERRSLHTKLPLDPAEFEAFADGVAKTVRETVLFMLKNRKALTA